MVQEKSAAENAFANMNIIDEFGPCTKQLVAAGRTYLKSLNAMITASRQYTEALAKIASLANNSTLSGSRDI
ncbi:brain-specific angiogenesis inhibitor 1-associated protein 2, partial [Trichonephila clavata]